jgi:hypothetical protein
MMMNIKKVSLLLILTFNIVFTQYPFASFELDEYVVDENSERASVTLQIDNSDLVDLGGITIFLYADTSVIKFDLESVSWNIDTPFEHESLLINMDIDTLKITAYSGGASNNFTVPFAKIFDIEFDIVGEANDSTLINFIKFQLQEDYTDNSIPTNIILVGDNSEEPPTLGCMDAEACNYNSAAITDDGNCEYETCAGCDGVPNSQLELDDCEVCGGSNYREYTELTDGSIFASCIGTDDCVVMDCAGDCKINGEEFPVMDDCEVCGGSNYREDTTAADGSVFASCIGTDDCVDMDCAGVCNGFDLLTPCADCSDDSDCDFSVSIATFTDPTIMDNNFRSNNIEIPISLNDFDFVGFSQLSQGTQGFEGMAFSVNFDPRLLEANSSNSIALIENMSYNFGVSQLNDSLSIISGILTDDANDPLYQSLDGPIVNLSFDVIESRYTPELHGTTSEISLVLTSLNGVNILQDNIEDTGTLTIYTKACIDPFASTFDSNFICDCTGGNAQCENDYNDVCDENGILETSNIFNDGCILPEPDFPDVLSSRIGDEEIIIEFDTYTLIIPDGTIITFPNGETSLDVISSAFVDISFLPDVAPGAQLAGPLVGLYPFGTTFDPPIEFLFTFEGLSRGTSEYKILYMDDIQTGDWEELGTCSGEVLGFCNIEELSSSGLFIAMFGENLEIDESIIPTNFNLYRSYPNPFNPTTTLEFDVANSGVVNFIVYNISGQIVESISPKFYTSGNYQIKWEARDFPSGIYLIQMRTKSSIHLQKVMLLK